MSSPESEGNRYFYSIEPFWSDLKVSPAFRSLSDDFVMYIADYRGLTEECVPGNGQVGLELYLDDGLNGRCYGVLKEPRRILLQGKEVPDRPLFVLCFAPGSFSKISPVPVHEIDAQGVALTEDGTMAIDGMSFM